MKSNDYDFIVSYAEKWLAVFSPILEFGGALIGLDNKMIKRIAPPEEILGQLSGDDLSKKLILFDEYIEKKSVAPDMIASNMQAIDERRAVRRLEVHNLFEIEPKVYMIFRHPIINPDTENVAGLWVFGYPVEVSNVSGLVSDFYAHDSKCRKNMKKENIRLTKREQQVVFFFMLNFKSEQIGSLITKIEKKTVSKDAVDQLFRRQLFPKFDVVNRKALYDKLNKMGFAQVIPYNVLDEGFSIEITNNNVFI
jgi:hypothetical protein